MSRINTPDDVNWSEFTSINFDIGLVQIDILNVLFNIEPIIESLEITEDDKTRTVEDINKLIYTISGVDPDSKTLISQESWYNIWLSQSRPNLFSFSVNFIIEKIKTNQTSNYSEILNQFDYVANFILERHFGTPIPTGYPNAGNKPRLVDNKSPYYTDMTGALQSFFLNGFSGINGVGNNTINTLCSKFSRSTIAKYMPIQEWCGCFSPDSEITLTAKKLYPESVSYTKACDPLCIYPNAIKIVDGQNSDSPGRNAQCNSTICVISKFDVENADLNGSINLTQNCPCSVKGTGGCFCVIDSSVESLLTKTRAPNGGSMADPVTFKQYCPGSQCFIEEPNGNLKQVTCENDNPGETGKINGATGNIGTVLAPNIWLLFLSLLGIGIAFILCARHIGYEPKFKVKGIFKPKMSLSKNTRSTDLGFFEK